MLKFLHRKALKRATEKQRAEIEAFITVLRRIGDDEVAFLVLGATNARIILQRTRDNLLDPLHAFQSNTNLAINLARMVATLQKEGRLAEAAAAMVWLFSVRTAVNPDIHDLGRQLWRELLRGFPLVHQAYHATNGILHNFDVRCLDEYHRIPAGLEPEGQLSMF